jgi:hypothetical protein
MRGSRHQPIQMQGGLPMPATATSVAAKTATAMEASTTAESAYSPSESAMSPTPTSSPAPPADNQRAAITVIRVSIVGIAVIIRIIRADYRHGWRRTSRCYHLIRRLGRRDRAILTGRAVLTRRRRRLLLLIGPLRLLLLLLNGPLLLLLQLAVALDHGFGDLLRHSQTLQIDNSIGGHVEWQSRIADVIDNHIFVDAALV